MITTPKLALHVANLRYTGAVQKPSPIRTPGVTRILDMRTLQEEVGPVIDNLQDNSVLHKGIRDCFESWSTAGTESSTGPSHHTTEYL